MHQNRFWLGLCPRPHGGAYSALPSWNKGAVLPRKGLAKGREREGEGRDGRGERRRGKDSERREREGCRKREEKGGERKEREGKRGGRRGKRAKGETRHTNPNLLPVPQKARICDFLVAININGHPIYYRFGVIAPYCLNFGHFASLSHPLEGLGATHDVHFGLFIKRIVDFLLVLIELFSLDVEAEAIRAKTNRKSSFFLRVGQYPPIFYVKGTSPPIIFARIDRQMNALQLCR